MAIVYFGTDYDGTWRNTTPKTDNPINIDRIVENQASYMQWTIDRAKDHQAKSMVVVNTSSRQTCPLDILNARDNQNGSCFHALPRFVEKINERLQRSNETFTVAYNAVSFVDHIQNDKAGEHSSFVKKWYASKDYEDATFVQSKKLYDVKWDKYKIALIRSQLEFIKELHPDEEIVFYFVDDRLDLLAVLQSYFDAEKIPEKITLQLCHKKKLSQEENTNMISDPTVVKTIKGTAQPQKNYKETLRDFVHVQNKEINGETKTISKFAFQLHLDILEQSLNIWSTKATQYGIARTKIDSLQQQFVGFRQKLNSENPSDRQLLDFHPRSLTEKISAIAKEIENYERLSRIKQDIQQLLNQHKCNTDTNLSIKNAIRRNLREPLRKLYGDVSTLLENCYKQDNYDISEKQSSLNNVLSRQSLIANTKELLQLTKEVDELVSMRIANNPAAVSNYLQQLGASIFTDLHKLTEKVKNEDPHTYSINSIRTEITEIREAVRLTRDVVTTHQQDDQSDEDLVKIKNYEAHLKTQVNNKTTAKIFMWGAAVLGVLITIPFLGLGGIATYLGAKSIVNNSTLFKSARENVVEKLLNEVVQTTQDNSPRRKGLSSPTSSQ